MQSILNLPPWNSNKSQQLENAIHAARIHQNLIGWDKIMQGILSKKWVEAQCLRTKLFPPMDKKRKKDGSTCVPECHQIRYQHLEMTKTVYAWQNHSRTEAAGKNSSNR